MSKKEHNMEKRKKQIAAIPYEMRQRAVAWLVNNIGIAEEMAKGKKVPQREIRKMIQQAIEKEDFVLLALVLYKECTDEFKREEQRNAKAKK